MRVRSLGFSEKGVYGKQFLSVQVADGNCWWQLLVARAIVPVLVHVIRGDRMGVPSQNHLTVGVVGVFLLGAATMVVPGGAERRRGTAN